MITIVLSFKDNEPFGVVIVDRKNASMYDAREAIKLWIETHLYGTDIEFPWGEREVYYTAGGAAPYRASLLISRTLEHVVLGE